MTEEQRIALQKALQEIHHQIHNLYPKGTLEIKSEKQLRDQLLVVDLIVHLADEVLSNVTPNSQQVTERTANLLYTVRLIAPDYQFKEAAEILLNNKIP
jgi:signal recognition particle GTPase